MKLSETIDADHEFPWSHTERTAQAMGDYEDNNAEAWKAFLKVASPVEAAKFWEHAEEVDRKEARKLEYLAISTRSTQAARGAAEYLKSLEGPCYETRCITDS